jgi:DNA-binding protein HU-alpha
MAISKSAADKPGTTAKAPFKSEKHSGPRGIPAPSIKPAAVVAPAVSIVGGTGIPHAAPRTEKSGDDQPHMLKKQELVERIVKASDARKKDIKLILEATLGALGDALSAGEELNLPPLGKIKVNRQKTEGGAEVLILKLRRGGGKVGEAADPKEGLAEEDEDD